MRAARFREFGRPEVVELVDIDTPRPGPGEVAVAVSTVGLNRFDLQIRAGEAGFPIPLPFVGGMEAVGRITELGAGVVGWRVGERVLRDVTDSCGQCRYCRSGREWACVEHALTLSSISGGFADILICDVRRLIRLPDGISDTDAAVVQMSYGTAWHMLFSRARLEPGEAVLVSSVGSGLGSAAADIAKHAGALVIGTSSAEAKLDRARERGLDEGINYRNTNVVEEVRRVTDGRGVDVAFEHVGGQFFVDALEALAMDGRLVTCGWHGGGVEVTVNLMALARGRKSIVGSVNRTREDLHRCLTLVEEKRLQPAIAGIYPLERLTAAMEALESGQTFGKVVIDVAAPA